jgi:hypothetical protein
MVQKPLSFHFPPLFVIEMIKIELFRVQVQFPWLKAAAVSKAWYSKFLVTCQSEGPVHVHDGFTLSSNALSTKSGSLHSNCSPRHLHAQKYTHAKRQETTPKNYID